QEDCAIKLGESLKKLEEELRALEREKEDRKPLKELAELEEELSDMRYSQSRLRGRLEELERELESLRSEVGGDFLQEYERLKRKHGLPIALPIDAFGACGSCGTKLPSALYSRLVSGEVVVCPSCGRLVYYEEAV
ncbi:MAG: C4-type zinc ribbon domain-containing protein, partial [Aquificaceae bacterium]|nr:C4-type zinc ribbon domain-containing protein [Aquificaceae bacterium]